MSAPLAGRHHANRTCDRAVSPLRGQRCDNQMALDWDCKGDAEAIQIQAVAQSVPLLLLYAAAHCHGAIAPLWTVGPVICDELQVSISLAAKQNTWHCSHFLQDSYCLNFLRTGDD
jgi:hypothetical protein